MSERHSPNPNRPRFTDEELIDKEIAVCIDTETTISAACARMISSQIHSGQATSLYSFASTGSIDDRLLREIELEYVADMDDEPQRNRLAFLSMYVAQRWVADDRDAIDGWPALWLEQPNESDYCPCCSEHISGNHRVGCPLGVDDEEQLARVQELQGEHGDSILAWLSYVGFRSLDELNSAAGQFEDYYHGTWSSLRAYAEYVAGELDNAPSIDQLVAELEQKVHVAEALDGTVHIFSR